MGILFKSVSSCIWIDVTTADIFWLLSHLLNILGDIALIKQYSEECF
jgi:hypothetical protein